MRKLGGLSDIMIEAQEYVYDMMGEDGYLTVDKEELRAMAEYEHDAFFAGAVIGAYEAMMEDW